MKQDDDYKEEAQRAEESKRRRRTVEARGGRKGRERRPITGDIWMTELRTTLQALSGRRTTTYHTLSSFSSFSFFSFLNRSTSSVTSHSYNRSMRVALDRGTGILLLPRIVVDFHFR